MNATMDATQQQRVTRALERLEGLLGVGALANVQGEGDDAVLLQRVETLAASGEAILLAMQESQEELMATLQVKNDLLAALSHQVRTAMNGVMGMTELALDTGLNAEQQDYLENAQNATRGLLVFLQEVLELSLIESQGVELAHEPFSLPLLLSTVCKTFQSQAEDKGTILSSIIRPGVPVQLVGDPARLRQVLQYLVTNAVALTEQGRVEVEARVFHPDSASEDMGELHASDDVHLLFIVRDNGQGIPLEKAVTIFDRVADPTADASAQPFGAGLPLSKRLLKSMGGHIWVDSGEGEGSWFCFTARLERAAPRSVD